jgi:hypothetical protein
LLPSLSARSVHAASWQVAFPTLSYSDVLGFDIALHILYTADLLMCAECVAASGCARRRSLFTISYVCGGR